MPEKLSDAHYLFTSGCAKAIDCGAQKWAAKALKLGADMPAVKAVGQDALMTEPTAPGWCRLHRAARVVSGKSGATRVKLDADVALKNLRAR
jgi:hypothetical protein